MDDIQPGAITAVLEEMADHCSDMALRVTTDAAIIDELSNLASHIRSLAGRVLGYETALGGD